MAFNVSMCVYSPKYPVGNLQLLKEGYKEFSACPLRIIYCINAKEQLAVSMFTWEMAVKMVYVCVSILYR